MITLINIVRIQKAILISKFASSCQILLKHQVSTLKLLLILIAIGDAPTRIPYIGSLSCVLVHGLRTYPIRALMHRWGTHGNPARRLNILLLSGYYERIVMVPVFNNRHVLQLALYSFSCNQILLDGNAYWVGPRDCFFRPSLILRLN